MCGRVGHSGFIVRPCAGRRNAPGEHRPAGTSLPVWKMGAIPATQVGEEGPP